MKYTPFNLVTPSIKFTLTNILFFGIIGSLIGGVLPAIPLEWVTFDYKMERTDRFFVTYIASSLIVGIVPGSITGYVYSKMYKKEFLKKGTVDFWKELKFGFLSALAVMLTICYLPIFGVMLFSYILDDITTTQLWNILRDSTPLTLILIICGVIGGVSCANLISEWNSKIIPTMIVVK